MLGTEHPDFIEGFDAAAANTVELFETLVPRIEIGVSGNSGYLCRGIPMIQTTVSWGL